MKKLLFVLFALAGITSAYAQSNVSVYGRLDSGFVGSNYKGVGTNPRATQSTTGFGSSSESPSLLGIKWTEDLGGGTSFLAVVETNVNPTSATLSSFTNRQTYLGLKQDGLGQVRVGTQYTPMFIEQLKSGAGRANAVVGDVIWPSNPQNAGNSGTAPFGSTNGTANMSDGQPYHTTNTVTYMTDNINGFHGTAFYTQNNQTSTASTTTANGVTNYAGGTNNSNGFGLSGNYTYNKLYSTLVYQSFKNTQPGTLTNPTPAPYTNNGPGINTSDNSLYVAAAYDFGPVTGFAQYITHKVASTINTNYNLSRQAQQLGVRGYWTPTIESWASIGNGKTTTFGASQPTANFIGYQVGSNYWLSKRTNLYAIYGQNNVSSASTNPSLGSNSYAAGLRHTF